MDGAAMLCMILSMKVHVLFFVTLQKDKQLQGRVGMYMHLGFVISKKCNFDLFHREEGST